MRNYNRIKYIGLFVGLLALPIIPLLFDKTHLDNNSSVCLSVLLFDLECYGCGMGRALWHLLHLDYEAAKIYNPLSFVVFPLLVFSWVKELQQLRKKIRENRFN